MAQARWSIVFVVILKITWSCSLSVTVTRVTTSSVALDWDSIEKTRVWYRSSASDGAEAWTAVSPGNRSNGVRIEDLQNNHTYIITITSGEKEWLSEVTTASCPAGWSGHEMICYLASNDGMTRENAAKQCASFSFAHLADPRTIEEVQFIGEVLVGTKKDSFGQIFYWIGVHDKDKDGDFAYSSDHSVTSSVRDFWEKCSGRRLPGADCFALWPDLSAPRSPYCAINACGIYAGYVCQYPVIDSPPAFTIATTSYQAIISWDDVIRHNSSGLYDVMVASGYGIVWTNRTQETFTVAAELYPGHLYSVTTTSLHHVLEHDVTSGGRYPATYFATKPLPPQNVSVKHVTPTSVVIGWSLPGKSENNMYHGFVVSFRSMSGANRATSSVFTSRGRIAVGNTTNLITLDNLEPLVTFRATVTSTINYSTTMGEVHSVSEIMNNITFETPVSPPQSFQATTVSTTGFRVIWEEAIGSPDAYVITMMDSKNETRKVYKFQKDANHTLLDGLVPGEKYIVFIVTQQSVNESAPYVIHQRTRPLPVAPQQVIVSSSLTTLSITINRYHPKESIFDGYVIALKSEDPPQEVTWLIKKNDTMWWDHDVIEGLTPGRIYQVVVMATSGGVRSAPVRIPPVTTILAPPSNLRLKSRDIRYLRLQWDAAPGDFDHYLVTCEGDAGINCSSQFMEVEHNLEVTFKDLLPGALYHFTVEAQDRKMRSEEASLSIRTLPEPPTDLRIETRDHSSVTLSWIPANHVLTGYKIEYMPQKSGFHSEASPSDGSVDIPLEGASLRTYVVVDNLMAGVLHDFSVATVSGNTRSTSKHISSSTRPLPVESLKVLEVGETWALITWKQGGGAAMYYKVSFQDDRGSIKSSRLSANMSAPSYNETSLLPSSLNYFTVETVSVQDVSSKVGVSIRARPLRPSNVFVGHITETSFQMKWHMPESETDRFVIELYAIKEHTRNVTSRKVNNGEASMTIKGLTEGTVYYVEVKSEFHDVASYPVQLEVTLYPNPPASLRITTSKTNELSLTWETPPGTNGGFWVEWEPHHGKVVSRDSTATLSDLTPGQEYSINVYTFSQNSMKRSRSSAYVVGNTLEAPPTSLNDVDITSMSNSSINLAWKPPRYPNGKILQYVINYQQLFPHPSIVPSVLNTSGDARETELEGLESGAGYYVTIAAQNSAGIGGFLDHRFIKCLDGTPGPVDDLIATTNSSSSIVVSWQPPEHPNGEITLYKLLVEEDDGLIVDEFEFYRKKNSNPFRCIFDGVSDIAFTSLLRLHGEGSNISITPINDLSTSSSHADYDKKTIRRYLSSYASQSSVAGGSELDELETVDHKKWSANLNEEDFNTFCPVHFTILGLKPYTRYHVNVRAWTSAGEGEEAASIVIVTEQEVPGGPPKYLHVFQAHPRNVTIVWTPPYPPNGILSYTLYLYSKDRARDQIIATNHTRMMVTNLNPYTKYAVAVQSRSEVGEGPWSPFLTFHTPEDVPEVVQNLSAMVDDSRSITVTWLPPLHPHGVIISYHVNVYDITRDLQVYQLLTNIARINIPRMKDSITFNRNPGLEKSFSLPQLTKQQRDLELGTLARNYSMTYNTYQLTKLKPFTNYSIAVSAMTSAGEGGETETTVLTKEDIPTSPPYNLAYTNLSSTSIKIMWDKPLEHNGVITSYTVGIARDELVKIETAVEFIVIEELEIYTPYEVYVWPWTALGEGPSSKKLLIHTDEDAPGSPPREVKYHNHSSTVIEVSWKDPLTKNGVIVSYTVYVDDGKTRRRQHISNTTRAVLEGLQPFSSYNVTVSASTRVGSGLESTPMLAHTMEGQPTSPPHSLSYKNLSSRSVELKWSKPVSANGIIQFYDVEVMKEGGDLASVRKLKTLDQSQTFVITSLRPFTRYFAKVRANTKYGDGAQESDPIIIWTMEDVPGSAPLNLSYVNVTSSSILMKWLPSREPNGIVTRYELSYWPSQERNKKISLNVSGDTIQHTFDNLMKYTEYEFTVAASTRKGNGPAAGLPVTTDEDAPSSPPYDVIYKQLSSTSILLSWKPPIHANGVILGYTIYYNYLTRGFQNESFHANITLKNLKKFGKYEVFVQARTRFGYGGQKSRKVSFETLEDAPSDPPHNVSVKASSSTSLNVSWQPPQYPNGHIQFYTIFYRTGNLARDVKTTDRTSFDLHGLEKYTSYTVWVTASTALGDGGHQSEWVNATTLEDVPDRPVANLTAWSLNSSSIHVVWSIALPVTGPTFTSIKVEGATDNQNVVYAADTDEEEVTVHGLLPYTTYRVTATPRVYGLDGYGPMRQSYVTTKQDKPTSPIQNLLVVNVTSSSAFLSWTSPKEPNGIISSYLLLVSPSEVVLEVLGNITSVNVTGLSPFKNYNVTIRSRTVIGPGPAISTAMATLQDSPSDPPQNVKVYNVTETSALASWSPPLQPNGVLTRYLIEYHPVGGKYNVGKVEVSAIQQSVVLQGLLPFVNYSLSVQAETEGGVGRLSSAPSIFTTLESVPGPPRNLSCAVTSEHHVLVSWLPPDHMNGVLTKYSLECKVSNSSGSVLHKDVNSMKSSANLGSLAPYSNYTVEVTGVTVVGGGEPAQCEVTTMQGYPGPPTELQVTNISIQTLTVTWQPPIARNGVISRYSLVYFPADGCRDNGGFLTLNQTDEMVQCEIDVGSRLVYRISFLRRHTDYVINVKAATSKGFGSFANPSVKQRTLEGVPVFPPRNVQAMALSSTSINVTWHEPNVHSGMTRYQVVANGSADGNMSQSNLLGTDQRHFVLTGLNKYFVYDITVSAVTSAGSLASAPIAVQTLEDAPGDVPRHINITVTPGNSTTANITFFPPLHPNGYIVTYTIQYHPMGREPEYVGISQNNLLDRLSLGHPYSWQVGNLFGGKAYRFRMRASTKVGPGPWSQWSEFVVLPITAPPLPAVKPEPLAGIDDDGDTNLGITSSSFTIRSPCVFSEENGPIRAISIVVVEEGADKTKEPTNWKQAYTLHPSPPYKVIVTSDISRDCPLFGGTVGETSRLVRKRELTSDKNGFVIGADTSCGDSPRKYCNGVLKPDTAYRVKYRAETTNGQITDTQYSEPIRTNPNLAQANTNLIIGIVVPVVVFFIVLAASLAFIKRRRGHSIQKPPESDFTPDVGIRRQRIIDEDSQDKGPIVEACSNSAFIDDQDPCAKVAEVSLSREIRQLEFGNHVTKLSMHKNKGFSDEFDDIRGLPIVGTTAFADKPCNRTKNRFSRLVPYDQFRVRLEGNSSIEGANYINASYLPGQRSADQFIATQTPLEHTKKDFWRMVWERGTTIIAMMGNDGKTKREGAFWPQKKTEHFGFVSVQLIGEDLQPDWTVRHLIAHVHGQSRNVTMFHMNNWPGSGMPGGVQVVLKFVNAIRLERKKNDRPLVVVCSSGSGRSGVFISLYRMLGDLNLKPYVDCFGVVAAMRRYRPYMVQTLSEYELIHRCMLDAVTTRLHEKRAPTGDGMEETIF